jgi:diguanylate cyclase (GGDEF)-like protein
LLTSERLTRHQLWRLTDSLFEQKSSLIQGWVALAVVQALCWLRSGSPWFGAALIVNTALLCARMWLSRHYARRKAGDPHRWACHFMWGGIAKGANWGVTSFAAVHFLPDPTLHLVIMGVQCGWVSALSVRNNASPATVWYQTLATVMPSFIAYVLSGDLLLQFASGFFLLQVAANTALAEYLGKRTLFMLLSEQEVADSNAKLSRACDELEEANARLQRLSHTDGLTGIGNRRAFDSELSGAWAGSLRDGRPISLLLFDVDMFKRFNDVYGHPAGDDCLRTVAEILGGAVRHKQDFAGRFGGEEFVVLLPGTDLPAASLIADRLRQEIAGAGLAHSESPFGVVTVSAGVSCIVPRGTQGAEALISAADKALYQAKQNGRNRVVTHRVAEAEGVLS